MRDKRLKINNGEMAAIIARARVYVNMQLQTMGDYGSAPALTPEQFDQLVSDCAKPAIKMRRWQAVHPGTPYCGVELVGGWCKRAVGHEGDHACS